MTYAELEHMMQLDQQGVAPPPGDRARLKRYRDLRQRNLHKMLPIPVCEIPQERAE